MPFEFHGADYLDGEDGDDYLEGGGDDDTIYGGAGNDRLWGDATAENIVGNAAGETTATLSLRAYGNDYLDGEDDNDELVGGGGDDVLYGGAGADRLWGDEDGIALPGELHGSDLLDGGEGDDYLAGGGGDDELVGGSGSDTLVGGAGADAMAGGPGNDVYVVDDVGDVVIEATDDGDDLVVSSIDIALPENVERLTLTGNAAVDAIGNERDNTITGGSGSNRLEGLSGNDVLIGGPGVDVLIGGAGDDLYQVDDIGDVVVESPDDGSDFVRTTVSYSLPENVEHLAADGGADVALTGNALGNGLFGNAGNNVLTGGAGNDYLVGGAGNDVYAFRRGDGQDAIDNTDAAGAIDTLRFEPGITAKDVTGMRSGDDLILRVKATTDLVRIVGHYAFPVTSGGTTSDRGIERVEFADGTTWDAAHDPVGRRTGGDEPCSDHRHGTAGRGGPRRICVHAHDSPRRHRRPGLRGFDHVQREHVRRQRPAVMAALRRGDAHARRNPRHGQRRQPAARGLGQ